MTTTFNQQSLYKEDRQWMVKTQILNRGIKDARILKAISTVPRHLFVRPEDIGYAYEDNPLLIGQKQTISQPYIVAFMTEAIQPQPTDRVLEIGTGSGYQAAILSQTCQEVYSIEIVQPLATQAKKILAQLKYNNVHIKVGDGYKGWPEAAPFDAIIITAATPVIPGPLIAQLKIGGRLVMPLEMGYFQNLIRITKTNEGIEQQTLLPVQFVPMTRQAREQTEKSN